VRCNFYYESVAAPFTVDHQVTEYRKSEKSEKTIPVRIYYASRGMRSNLFMSSHNRMSVAIMMRKPTLYHMLTVPLLKLCGTAEVDGSRIRVQFGSDL